LKRSEGVISANASSIKGTAVVVFDPEKTSPQALVAVINTGTFYRASLPSASLRSVVLKIGGMKNEGAASRIASVLNKLDGIEGGSLDLKKEEAQLAFDSKKLTVEQIARAVDSDGPFTVSVQSVSTDGLLDEGSGRPLREKGWFRSLWRSIANYF